MEWVLKLEAKSGWGEVETIEVGKLERRVVGLTEEEVGLTLSEGKGRLGELARLVIDPAAEIVVLIDGAQIRAAHGYQSRHLDVTVGKTEVTGKPPRRFALAPRGAESPLATLRQALRDQGWQAGRPVTVISDGEAALPGLVRAAVAEPITCILDWWHISMRVQHIEQAVRGVYALDPRHRAGLEMVEWRIGRLRHLIWNGYHEEAHDELFGMRHMASEVAYVNGDKFRPSVARLLWNCDDLRRYLANNIASLIDYGERYR